MVPVHDDYHCRPASNALSIEFTRSSRPNGLMSKATGEAPSASRRVSSSVCAVIRMTGSLQPDAASVSHNSTPFISGRSISTMRHALAFGKSLLSSVLGRSKVRTSKPAPTPSRRKAFRIDGSSSITMIIGFCVTSSVITSAVEMIAHIGCTQYPTMVRTTTPQMRYKNRQPTSFTTKTSFSRTPWRIRPKSDLQEARAEEEWSMSNPNTGSNHGEVEQSRNCSLAIGRCLFANFRTVAVSGDAAC